MTRIPLGAALCLALAATAACSPTVSRHGNALDDQAISAIAPGVSTKREVVQGLGTPSVLSAFDDSSWFYIQQINERRSFYQNDLVEQKVVAVHFDDAGIVTEVERRDLADARLVSPVERQTPTGGNEVSLVQQLVGNLGRFNTEGRQSRVGEQVDIPGT